ncbi:MAG TPA: hypothetical protein VF494_03970 [Candidatus Limnocylindrales bacterium]
MTERLPPGDPLGGLFDRWRTAAAVPPPPLFESRPTRMTTSAIGIVLVAVVAILSLRAWAMTGATTPEPSATIGGSPLASRGVATESPVGIASVQPSLLPTTSPPGASRDPRTALSVATIWEEARATGDWTKAWGMLAPYSQAIIGTEAAFASGEATYNQQGGATSVISDPTQNPDFLSTGWLGAALYLDLQTSARVDEAWVVFVRHPKVAAASYGTSTLVVAPTLDGQWEVWIGK